MLIDDIKLIITLARQIQNDTSEAPRLLKIIKDLDLRQEYSLNQRKASVGLRRHCREIYLLSEKALQEQKLGRAELLRTLLNKIINLENLILDQMPSETFFVPSKILEKVLNYSPKEAVSRGFLFRGLSSEDYAKIMVGQDLFARNPKGKVDLIDHILDPTNNPDTPFISLTSDLASAQRFGHIVAVDIKKLRGHLYRPEEIEAILRRNSRIWSRAKKLQKKNSEFLLGPTRYDVASIPVGAVVH